VIFFYERPGPPSWVGAFLRTLVLDWTPSWSWDLLYGQPWRLSFFSFFLCPFSFFPVSVSLSLFLGLNAWTSTKFNQQRGGETKQVRTYSIHPQLFLYIVFYFNRLQSSLCEVSAGHEGLKLWSAASAFVVWLLVSGQSGCVIRFFCNLFIIRCWWATSHSFIKLI